MIRADISCHCPYSFPFAAVTKNQNLVVWEVYGTELVSVVVGPAGQGRELQGGPLGGQGACRKLPSAPLDSRTPEVSIQAFQILLEKLRQLGAQ